MPTIEWIVNGTSITRYVPQIDDDVITELTNEIKSEHPDQHVSGPFDADDTGFSV